MNQTLTFTLGNVKVFIDPKPSSLHSSSSSPKLITEESTTSTKVIQLKHFSGILRVSLTTDDTAGARGSTITPRGLLSSTAKNSYDESERLLEHMEDESSVKGNLDGLSISVGRNKESVSEVERMTTPLHISCGSSSPSIAEMKTMFEMHPESASVPDTAGRLPIHIFAQNEDVFRLPNGRQKAEAFANQLLNANPESVFAEDNNGRIPFTEEIVKWIDQVHTQERSWTAFTALAFLENESDNNKIIPRDVTVPSNVQWCIHMLSSILDRVSDRSTRDAFSENIASIPFFVKTVLLIDNDDLRSTITNSSIFRRTILSPNTVGEWIVSMLQARKQYSRNCVEYFELLSNSKLAHFMGRSRKPHPSDLEQFQDAQNDVMEEIGKYDNLLPSLVVLSNKQIERAASTQVIWQIMDKAIFHPFVISMTAIDIALQLALMIVFREASFVHGVVNSTTDSTPSEFFENETSSVAILLILCQYFGARKMYQSISMISISLKVFWANFFEFWNLLHIATIVMTFFSSFCLLFPGDFATQLSITMGLLWLSLLSHLKAINRHMASFLLSFQQIIKDISWFLLILIMVICMFADMGHIRKTSSGECFLPQNNTNITNTTLQYGGDTFHTALEIDESNGSDSWNDMLSAFDLSNPFCSDNLVQSYLAVYLIIMGDFDSLTSDESRLSRGLFIMFSFLVMIVLLNCLIALVLESYEQSKVNTRKYFGRARAEFAAEQNAFIKQLQRGQCQFSGNCSLANCIKRCMLCSYRWVVLTEIFLVTFTIFTLSVEFIINYQDGEEKLYGKPFLVIIFSVIAIILGISLVVVLDFIFEGCFKSCSLCASIRRKVIKVVRKITYPCFGKLSRTLGITSNDTGYDEEESGRVSASERNTTRTVQESEERLAKMIKTVQSQMLTNDAAIRADLETCNEKLKKICKKQYTGEELDSIYETESNDDDDDSMSSGFAEYRRRNDLLSDSNFG